MVFISGSLASRSFDAERMAALANDPSIRPFVGGDGKSYIDLTEAVANRDNHFVAGEHGAFAFSWSAPRVYEVHTFILPEGRGAWAKQFALDARDYMDRISVMLWTRVPVAAGNIRAFTEKAGFSRSGSQSFEGHNYDLYVWEPRCQ